MGRPKKPITDQTESVLTQSKPRARKPITREYSEDEIIAALEWSGGIVNAAAKRLRCHRATIHYRIKHSERIRQALEDAREAMLDDAEDALRTLVKRKNVAAVIFTLKTRGRERGYGENLDVHLSWQDELRRAGIDPNAAMTELARQIESGAIQVRVEHDDD